MAIILIESKKTENTEKKYPAYNFSGHVQH